MLFYMTRPCLTLPEAVCAIGQGVSGLCCAIVEGQKWIFTGYSLTGVSLTPHSKFMKANNIPDLQEKIWLLVSYNFHSPGCVISQPSVFELVRSPDFANLPLIVEDFVKDSGGSYTGECGGR